MNPRLSSPVALARWCGIHPHSSPDSRKGGVRLDVHELRRERVSIVADRPGCWPTETIADLADRWAYRYRNGLTHLTEAARDRRCDPAADASGQLTPCSTGH